MKNALLVLVLALVAAPLPAIAEQTPEEMRREIEADFARQKAAAAAEKSRREQEAARQQKAAEQSAKMKAAIAEIKAKRPVRNSGWDGSVWQVESFMKGYLKDPDSFEAITWGAVIDMGQTYTVRLRYRARNGFGGFAVSEQTFTLDFTGNVIGVE